MEEDIFIVETFLKNKEMLLKYPCWVSEKTIQAIENLINKYKEQEKVIELMVDRLSYDAFYMDDASEYCEVKKKECDCYQNKSGCKECLLDYFKKKARDENEHT